MIDKFEMIDQVLVLLDGLSVSGAKNVIVLSNVFQMLNTLKKGLRDETDANQKVIEMLKRQLEEGTGLEVPGDDTEVVGGQHFELDFKGDS